MPFSGVFEPNPLGLPNVEMGLEGTVFEAASNVCLSFLGEAAAKALGFSNAAGFHDGAAVASGIDPFILFAPFERERPALKYM
jgi:hypothetical protein